MYCAGEHECTVFGALSCYTTVSIFNVALPAVWLVLDENIIKRGKAVQVFYDVRTRVLR